MEYIQQSEPIEVHGLVVASYGSESVRRAAAMEAEAWGGRAVQEAVGARQGGQGGARLKTPVEPRAVAPAAWSRPSSLRRLAGSVQLQAGSSL